MVEGLTYIEDSQSRSLLMQYFALQFSKAHTPPSTAGWSSGSSSGS